MIVPRRQFFSAFTQLKEYHDLMLLTLEKAQRSNELSDELLDELQKQVNIVTGIVIAFKKCADTTNIQKKSSNLH